MDTGIAQFLRRAFRDASWLNYRRVRDYAFLLIVGQFSMVIWVLMGRGLNDPAGRPIGTDFLGFWTVSWALLHGKAAAIYVPQALAGLEAQIIPQSNPGYVAWQYPPVALLIVAPLALVPYLWSLALWVACGLSAYVSSLQRILSNRLTPLLGMAFPAVWATITHGQTSLIAVPLLTWALILLPKSPAAAGLLLGLLAFKPQFGLMVPLALAAGGHWRCLGFAASTAAGLILVSIVLFGMSSWIGFAHGLTLTRAILDQELVPYYKMQSVFAGCRLIGVPLSVAYGLQSLVAICAAVCVAWVWRGDGRQALKNAALAAAVPLGSPFFLDYDLMILAPAIAWTVAVMQETCVRPWEKSILAAALVAPFVARVLGEAAHLPITPFVVAALLATIVMRVHAERLNAICGIA
jgi:hypothetical protein